LQIGVFIEKVNNQKRQHRLIIIATACSTRAAFNHWYIPILFHQFYAAYAWLISFFF